MWPLVSAGTCWLGPLGWGPRVWVGGSSPMGRGKEALVVPGVWLTQEAGTGPKDTPEEPKPGGHGLVPQPPVG